MKGKKLTSATLCAHKNQTGFDGRGRGSVVKIMGLLAGLLVLPACITVNAPNDAIVIELNINITQEVIYRLAADADNTIAENADIF